MAKNAFISSRLAAETPAYGAFHEMSRGADPEALEEIGIHEPYTEMERFDQAREVVHMLMPEVRRQYLNTLSDEELAEIAKVKLEVVKSEGGREHIIEVIMSGEIAPKKD